MRGVEIAESKLGLQEVTNRKALMDFFKQYAINNDITLDPQTTPWCAAFINACERAVGNKGTGRVNARSFMLYGTKVDLTTAKAGDICIFARGNNNWQGHVAYFTAKTGTDITILGGNQKDSVCYAVYSTEHLLSIRRSPNAIS